MNKIINKIPKKTVIIISIVALALQLVQAVFPFILYIPSFESVILDILFLLPFVLLVLYLLKFLKHLNATTIISIISASLVLPGIAFFIMYPDYWSEMWYIAFNHMNGFKAIIYLLSTEVTRKFLSIVLFVIMTIGSIKRISIKPLITIPLISFVLITLTSIKNIRTQLHENMVSSHNYFLYSALQDIINIICTILLCFVLIWLCEKIYNRSKPENMHVSLEEELTKLKEERELNIISKEEYDEKRKEMISKL